MPDTGFCQRRAGSVERDGGDRAANLLWGTARAAARSRIKSRSRLIRKWTRTLSGKLKEWLYTWNDDDQLIQVATPDRGTWAYRYDPFGRRVAKQRVDGADAQPGRVSEYVEFTWDETRVAEQVTTLGDV
jgi:YD repeat-containing protein